MDSYIVEIARYVVEARDGWNFNADEHNQWDVLSLEEQHELIGNALKYS
jgi:hypothetical protein